MNRLTKFGVAALALVAAAGVSIGAGLFPGFPIVGQGSYCGGTSTAGVPGTAGVCNNTVPAGPPLITGYETFPADTNLPSGQAPQTVLITTGLMDQRGSGSERNSLRGGDFNLNLWQRGTSYASITPTVATYVADGWFAFSTGNTVTVAKKTTGADISVAGGILASMQVNRPSGTDVTPICVGQFLPNKQITRFLGNNAIFSASLLNGSAMSATNGAVTMTIAYVTATDSATAGTNTATFALSTTTGYTAAVATLTPVTTTWTRYSVAAAIPTTATGIGVKVCYTPIGTGTANDYFDIANAQLEAALPTVTVNGTVTQTGMTAPGSFARRNPAEEAQLEQSFSFVIPEPAASLSVGPSGQGASTTTCVLSLPTPVSMRITPVVTFAGSALSGSTWTITHVVTNTALGTPYLAATTGGSTPNSLNITATAGTAALTVGQTCTLTGAGGTAQIVASAEP